MYYTARCSFILIHCSRTLQRLRHPNIVRYIADAETSDALYCATELSASLLGMLHETNDSRLNPQVNPLF